MSRAFEFALTTAIFAGVGLAIDHWLGTSPLAVVLLTLLGVVGQFARMWYAYDAQMRQHEAALPSAGPGAAHHTVPRHAPSDRDRAPLPSVTAQVVGMLRNRGRIKS